MTISVRDPWSGYQLDVDLRTVAAEMTAREQKKLFKQMGLYISDEDCQRAMDDLEAAILESRAEAAKQILAGEWPVQRPLSTDVLYRFAAAQLPIVMSVCKKPNILIKYEEEKEKKK